MVNKSKNIEVNEMTKPNIINGLDLTFSSSLELFLEDINFLSLLERRLEKGLITISLRSDLITQSFKQIFMVIYNILTTYYGCKFHVNAKFCSPWSKMLKNFLITMCLT